MFCARCICYAHSACRYSTLRVRCAEKSAGRIRNGSKACHKYFYLAFYYLLQPTMGGFNPLTLNSCFSTFPFTGSSNDPPFFSTQLSLPPPFLRAQSATQFSIDWVTNLLCCVCNLVCNLRINMVRIPLVFYKIFVCSPFPPPPCFIARCCIQSSIPLSLFFSFFSAVPQATQQASLCNGCPSGTYLIFSPHIHL